MRALTIRQPCATLVAHGLKDVENRTKPPPRTVAIEQGGEVYRVAEVRDDGPVFLKGGPTIVVHAGKAEHPGCWATAYHVLGDDLSAHPALLSELPRGALVGKVRLAGWHHASDCVRDDVPGAVRPKTVLCSPWALGGDMWHWQLADARPFDVPLTAAGRLGLWTIDLEELTP